MNESISWRELINQSDDAGQKGDYARALQFAREALSWAKRQFGESSYEVTRTWQCVARAASFDNQKEVVKEAETALQALDLSLDSALYKADKLAFQQGDLRLAI